MTADDRLAEIARYRSQLGTAMKYLEAAAAAPVGKESWVNDLRHSLRQLEVAWNHHLVEMQNPNGVLDQIVEQAPRLQRSVGQMRDAQTKMAGTIGAAMKLISDADEGADPAELREAAIAALVAVTRHRQRGADLIYDAYDIDIGGY
jgi:hypothetical protein